MYMRESCKSLERCWIMCKIKASFKKLTPERNRRASRVQRKFRIHRKILQIDFEKILLCMTTKKSRGILPCFFLISYFFLDNASLSNVSSIARLMKPFKLSPYDVACSASFSFLPFGIVKFTRS